jgi:thioredoxin reductase (NADPH)
MIIFNLYHYMNTVHNFKIAVIGSGPAGLTAAIYTSRGDIETIIYSGSQPGGQLTTTTEIENFPGFVDGIMGPELMSNMQSQAERFGAKLELAEVSKIIINKDTNKKFTVVSESGEADFDGIIIASGAKAKYLNLPDEEKWIGKGYHSCATCDGFFYKNKVIVVVGGGDSAMEEANFLTKFGSIVYIIHRNSNYKASKIMLDRAKANPKIKFIENKIISKLQGSAFIESIELTDTLSGEKTEMVVDGVFMAIGHQPNSEFVKNILDMDTAGYLLNQTHIPQENRNSKYQTSTKIEGIFVAGDIQDTIYRQAITAAGDGCKAAMDLEKWLEDSKA